MQTIRNCFFCKRNQFLKQLPCCGQFCCKDCFKDYIAKKIHEKYDEEKIPCLNHKNNQCNHIYSFEDISSIIGNEQEAFELIMSVENELFTYQPSVQECAICCEQVPKDNFITLVCGDKACKECIIGWLNCKFEETKGNFSIDEVGCINTICKKKDTVTPVLLYSLFSKEQADKVMNYTIEGYFNFQCPFCMKKFEYKDQVSADANEHKIQCPYCYLEICALCKQKFHEGQCENVQQQLRRAIGYSSYYSYCPYCFCGPNLKDDNCDHVTCKQCKKDFCFFCWCPREPILCHGNQYHRKECIFYQPWIDPTTKKEHPDEFNPQCSFCQKFNQVCPKPIPFETFLANLQMSTETIKRELKKKQDIKNKK